MKKPISRTIVALFIPAVAVFVSGCVNTDSHSHSSGTHRMGTPKENYQMSNEHMQGGQAKPRPAGSSSSDTSGTHRMGTPKENYQMSNEQMKRN